MVNCVKKLKIIWKLIRKAIIISLIQHFEADFLWKVSLKILNSGLILKIFTQPCRWVFSMLHAYHFFMKINFCHFTAFFCNFRFLFYCLESKFTLPVLSRKYSIKISQLSVQSRGDLGPIGPLFSRCPLAKSRVWPSLTLCEWGNIGQYFIFIWNRMKKAPFKIS